MPIYEYRCKSCGHDVEALQKVLDPPLKKCPECGRRMLARLMSAPSFRLKGGGWYETDFKSDSEKKRNLVDAGDGAAKDGGGSDKEAASGKDAASSKDAAKDGSRDGSKDAAAAKSGSTATEAKSESKAPAKESGKAMKGEKGMAKKATRAAAK
jgi:putative FmdB family regulatory protein